MRSLKKKDIKMHFHFWFLYHCSMFGCLISHGRKLYAFNFLQDVKYALKHLVKKDIYLIFLVSMLKVTPSLILFNLRMGSGKLSVPMPIRDKKKIMFSLKWTIKLLKDRSKTRCLKTTSLAKLIFLNFLGKGDSVKLRNNFHKNGLLGRPLINKLFR